MRKSCYFLLLLSLLQLSCAETEGRDGHATEQQEQIQKEETTASEEEVIFRTSSKEIKSALKQEAPKNAIFQQEALQQFYSNRNFEPAWNEKEDRESLFSSLKAADLEGLKFSDYHKKELTSLLERQLDSSSAAQLDLLLTDAFLQYAHDLYYGRLNPKRMYKQWGVERREKNLAEVLDEGFKKGKIAEALEELKPQHQVYRDLKTALKEFAAQKDEELKTPKISEGKLLKPGQKDSRISAIIERLKEKEFEVPKMSKNDSLYSEAMEVAVKEFQKERGLQTDGIIGNSTIKELNMSPTDRYKQILANLERWRWYPRDLGSHYILINVANFRLAVVKEGDTIREHKVIAGTRSRQTPTFTDTLEYIVINPEWHIPSSISRQEVIPKAANNPNYLSSHNMKVFANGSRIPASEIDWSSPAVRNYNFMQVAGPSNPLGRVKIIYPNKYLIYLHDTPAQSLFSKNQRAASHGCVRVENAVDLAAYVIEEQEDWDKEKINEVIASGKTTKVKIHRPIQVHHFYWTAWRDGGKTVFSPDVYDLDKNIYSKLLED
ncbi:MAG: L,D-transpeptidase family protein [Salinimicrobium sp.]